VDSVIRELSGDTEIQEKITGATGTGGEKVRVMQGGRRPRGGLPFLLTLRVSVFLHRKESEVLDQSVRSIGERKEEDSQSPGEESI